MLLAEILFYHIPGMPGSSVEQNYFIGGVLATVLILIIWNLPTVYTFFWWLLLWVFLGGAIVLKRLLACVDFVCDFIVPWNGENVGPLGPIIVYGVTGLVIMVTTIATTAGVCWWLWHP